MRDAGVQAPRAPGPQGVAGDAGARPAALGEQLMRAAMAIVREARERARPGAERAAQPETAGLDPDRAALIGAEVSPLMTTMGSLESKRLATDPRWAHLLVRQLSSHRVMAGSTIVASFSGSFPGLNIAVMAACAAMHVRLIAISSVTASTWGANVPGFTWPEMEALIVRAGVLPVASVAVSIGGTRDSGRDLSEEGRDIARRIQREAAAAFGARALETTTLSEAVEARLAAYREALGSTRPALYINVGGNHASLGGAEAPLRHEEGWIEPAPARDNASRRSVVAAWRADGVPVLNLLDVKTLAKAWGL